MRAVVQRVRRASVTVEGEVVGAIGPGLLILLGVHETDTEDEIDWGARKCARLRIFADDEGLMNRSLQDVGGEALVVSQFTLYGDATKGNRPSFVEAAPPDQADRLYERFVAQLDQRLDTAVQTGTFGAMMDVALVNDGPVTILVERDA
ncbi:MAG: D-tyrosyl-tRNA(Tyr) deacylase [Bacteroidetes bacterium]|nr:D-tyrosyl-tRNA(Tyr) deacylase [Bacteroidota bacterium]